MVLTAYDKKAIKVTVAAWIVCGAAAWILQQPAWLLIALGISWVCGHAVMRVAPVKPDRPSSGDDAQKTR